MGDIVIGKITPKNRRKQMQSFIFRNIKQNETDQANTIEQICFPPHEACSEMSMVERIRAAEEWHEMSYTLF